MEPNESDNTVMIEMSSVEVASNICKLREIELFGVKIGVYKLGE